MLLTASAGTDTKASAHPAGCPDFGASSFGITISGFMRFHETCALWTALNSLAAFDDLSASLVKHARNVANAATLHSRQPVPRTFFPPK